jgi:short-subunit dehydrogenase
LAAECLGIQVAQEPVVFDSTQLSQLSKLLRTNARAWRNSAVGTVLTGGVRLSDRPLRQRVFGSPRFSDVLSGQHVLVSGASSGIGRAVALKVAEAGAIAVLVARSADKLQELKATIEQRGGRARVYAADLSRSASADALLAKLASDAVVIDVLINNAGRSIRRPIEHAYDRAHDYERTMALNYFGALRLILGLLPAMRARKRGHIINVSSAGVQMATPLFSAYIASKAALDAFTRVAAGETHGDGVHFTTVHMPLVRTPMIAPTEEYQHVPTLSPEQAADVVLRTLVTGEKQLGTRIARLVSLAHIVAPQAVERLLSVGHRMLAQREHSGALRDSPCELAAAA